MCDSLCGFYELDEMVCGMVDVMSCSLGCK